MTDNNRVIAIVIYAVAASTDWMDGQIARMTKTVSWLGKVMDPICDRALLFTGVLGLVVRGESAHLGLCAHYRPRHLSGHRHAYRASLSPSPHRCRISRKNCHCAAHDRLLAHAAQVPVIDRPAPLPSTLAAFPGLNGSSVPFGIFFVYGGAIFSMLTAVIYSIKGGAAIKQALAHPEDEDIDFLNPEIED